MVYEEDGVIIEQEDSYNNVTGEARLVVPAHGNNSGIEVIIQESSMVTVENDFCQVSSVPDNIKPSNMEDNADDVSNRTANSTISSEQENTVYSLKLDEGELSADENDELSPSMKEACGDRPIVKTTVQETDQAVFNEMAEGGIVNIPQTRGNTYRIRRQTGCTTVKVYL